MCEPTPKSRYCVQNARFESECKYNNDYRCDKVFDCNDSIYNSIDFNSGNDSEWSQLSTNTPHCSEFEEDSIDNTQTKEPTIDTSIKTIVTRSRNSLQSSHK